MLHLQLFYNSFTIFVMCQHVIENTSTIKKNKILTSSNHMSTRVQSYKIIESLPFSSSFYERIINRFRTFFSPPYQIFRLQVLRGTCVYANNNNNNNKKGFVN
jgi:hypothetical protein